MSNGTVNLNTRATPPETPTTDRVLIWVDRTTKIPQYTDDAGVSKTLKGDQGDPGIDGVAVTIGIVFARRTTNLELPGTSTDITFDTEELETDATIVEHDNINTEKFFARQAGNFGVFISLAIRNASATSERTLILKIRKNGTTNVALRSFDIAKATTEYLTLNAPIALDANDFITLQLQDDPSGDLFLEVNATFILKKLDGVKGDKGDAGADGDITWEGNWVSQDYTANQAVFYSPTGTSYVVHTDTTAFQVPTDTNFWDILASKGNTGDTGMPGPNDVKMAFPVGSADSTSSTYEAAIYFDFEGTADVGTPSEIAFVAQIAGATDGSIRIFDETNSNEIGEIAAFTDTVPTLKLISSLSNLPVGPAIFSVQLKRNGSGGDNVSLLSVSVNF